MGKADHFTDNSAVPIRFATMPSLYPYRAGVFIGRFQPYHLGHAQMLERATETIVQQVEAMKEMVNAFSEYARAPRLEMATVDLNKMVTEVSDLYRAQGAIRGVRLTVVLDPAIDGVVARCLYCGKSIVGRSSRAKFCTDNHRNEASKKRKIYAQTEITHGRGEKLTPQRKALLPLACVTVAICTSSAAIVARSRCANANPVDRLASSIVLRCSGNPACFAPPSHRCASPIRSTSACAKTAVVDKFHCQHMATRRQHRI